MLTLPFANTQPVEKQELREDGALDIVNVWATIQGEGPFAGKPAIFIRLAGCDLQCPNCDSDYTTGRRITPVEHILEKIDIEGMFRRFVPLVVITGGEPFRQNMIPLVEALLRLDYFVQIETNGTLTHAEFFLKNFPVHIVCSPKTTHLNRMMMGEIYYLKYILEAGKVDPEDGLPTSSLGMTGRPARPWEGFEGNVYLQPQDDNDPEKNKANTKAVVESCMKYGYTCCLQLHKILGLD